tara:strand:+ start:3196 stop:3558 length:363 start_codon:yes stop_codon:yes gene_type:complete
MKNLEKSTPIFKHIQKVEKSQSEQNRENFYIRFFGDISQREKIRTDLIEYMDKFIGYHENIEKIETEKLMEIVSKHMLSNLIYQAVGDKPIAVSIDDASIKFKVKEYDWWFYLHASRIPE